MVSCYHQNCNFQVNNENNVVCIDKIPMWKIRKQQSEIKIWDFGHTKEFFGGKFNSEGLSKGHLKIWIGFLFS
jgi:hypothetical protein